MWASVHIVAPSDDKTGRMIDTVHIWLAWPGSLPLSISLTISQSGRTAPDASTLLKALTRYSLRWTHLRLSLPSDQFEPLSFLSSEDVPILEKAIVDYFGGQDADQNVIHSRLAFLRATSLWSASLDAQFISPEMPFRREFLRSLF
ncbi:hypothetical protein C8J57DRAFT_1706216 [Mycena rebaudengoi]|nr:hypothetical protein C8J57DRAFT_1706216 [Mycena rebaudengoi]